MTARIRSLTVALSSDIREDDVQSLIDAIQMMRNVISVTGNEVTPNDWTTEMRVRNEVFGKLMEVAKEMSALNK
tara:strand:+ start:1171 stop:1392 length:222 start_codon:yes stop_codon:yes gene_type:complete